MARHVVMLGMVIPVLCGCALQEVRSKSLWGPEWQHKGSDSTDAVRYYAQEGLEFKWDKGIATTVTYRRRDVDDGNGDNDNGVWFDISFPLWKAKPKEKAAELRIAELERRLALVETENRRLGPQELDASLAQADNDPGDVAPSAAP